MSICALSFCLCTPHLYYDLSAEIKDRNLLELYSALDSRRSAPRRVLHNEKDPLLRTPFAFVIAN